jgi:CO/xanthine dehydrogenase FAD-binding subunit
MIIEYYRPDTIEEALRLISRRDPITVPMGGGTWVNRPSDNEYAVVDLQSLGLDKIDQRGQLLLIGATVTLEKLLQFPDIHPVLSRCLQLECTYNLRHMRTIAGTVVAADGRSPLVTMLLALDAQLRIDPGEEEISIGNILPVRSEQLSGRLILQLIIPLTVKLAYHYVARTPADFPLVCAAAAKWPSGRIRIALGGHGKSPLLAMDGPEAGGAEDSAKTVYDRAADQWASAEYRKEIAATLTRRCLDDLAEDS